MPNKRKGGKLAKGIAVSLGLNAVDPKHYGGWSGQLVACEADADDMFSIANTAGFAAKKLLTKQATRAAVTKEIKAAAKTLKAGDIFMLSYSGHGGQLPDQNGDEADNEDETWCLYDGQLVDDEIYVLLGKFAAGVRVLVFSDSCHSGSVLRMTYYGAVGSQFIRDGSGAGGRYRAMPHEVAMRTYRDNRKFYDRILQNPKLKEAPDTVAASAILLSGCMDNQLSQDGDFNGLFTGTLLRVWNHGSFNGNYHSFHAAIVQKMPPDQTPNFFKVGASDPAFEGQKPFAI